ncbi:glycine/sarcosine/betaine reductase complex component C subunit beta [Dongshaea marina]|uniref:glycine/sarcosine/betaine reductase complex component C subunit beta n=1 Tax=Dongshaea marina TaxID=2047966 RepID=UPI000D3E9695|nr:glycine/sarcosine/betaine reductase complex component C subunit beta [Dongshaea marina]
MSLAVIKGASYILAHAPEMLVHQGAVASQTRHQNPDDPYLKEIRSHLRSFSEVASYPPNQCYIGNIRPDSLNECARPWYQNAAEGSAQGKMGEVLSEGLLYVLMQHVDAFELVQLSQDFCDSITTELNSHPLLGGLELTSKLQGSEISSIIDKVEGTAAEGLYYNDTLIGCVNRAHDSDENLSAHIMLENLATKATSYLAGLHLDRQGIDLASIDYILECSEEACGDINQRGGGNFAKAIGEQLGCSNANGADIRGFCAAPVHALLNASALVQAGIFSNVMVVAGGAVAKLGMNGRDHAKQGMPLLEDVLGGFAFVISANDGVSPVINTKVLGRHTIGTGSSPQAVMTALIASPLKANGLSIPQVDKYTVEMQNPEVTKPAGAGDVPEANYKMIAALAVKEGWLQRSELMNFVSKHGMPGFAPTQGHIPSGVPFLGHGREMILEGELNNFMVVGKGSLFLGRMTNQFDGLSFLVEKNSGQASETQAAFDETAVRSALADAMRKVAAELKE